jgi:hypothetical protein
MVTKAGYVPCTATANGIRHRHVIPEQVQVVLVAE